MQSRRVLGWIHHVQKLLCPNMQTLPGVRRPPNSTLHAARLPSKRHDDLLRARGAVHESSDGVGNDLRQRVFMGWLAPRGIVTASVASLFSIRLEQAGILGAGRLQGLVFLTILMTVGLQGLTAQPLARVLGLIESPDEPGSASVETATQPGQVLPDPSQ